MPQLYVISANSFEYRLDDGEWILGLPPERIRADIGDATRIEVRLRENFESVIISVEDSNFEVEEVSAD